MTNSFCHKGSEKHRRSSGAQGNDDFLFRDAAQERGTDLGTECPGECNAEMTH